MNLAEFKKIVAAWPDHEGDGALDEDAQVWIETGFGLSTAVAEVLKLNQHDMLIVSNAFEEKTASPKKVEKDLVCPSCFAHKTDIEAGRSHFSDCKGSGGLWKEAET